VYSRDFYSRDIAQLSPNVLKLTGRDAMDADDRNNFVRLGLSFDAGDFVVFPNRSMNVLNPAISHQPHCGPHRSLDVDRGNVLPAVFES